MTMSDLIIILEEFKEEHGPDLRVEVEADQWSEGPYQEIVRLSVQDNTLYIETT